MHTNDSDADVPGYVQGTSRTVFGVLRAPAHVPQRGFPGKQAYPRPPTWPCIMLCMLWVLSNPGTSEVQQTEGMQRFYTYYNANTFAIHT